MSSRASALWLSLSLLAILPSQAADRIQPSMLENSELTGWMPDGAQVETRLDADVTGDGLRDLVFVARNDEMRVLKVLVAYANEFDMGFDPLGEMRMGDSPLGDATSTAAPPRSSRSIASASTGRRDGCG
jgi:hypothetical protein